MVFSPALQSTIPTLVPDRDSQQAINGLFDATYRIARLVGPMVAALLHIFLPVIHFLTATALGFIVSGMSLQAARERLVGPGDPVRMRPGLGGRLGCPDRGLPPDAERARHRRHPDRQRDHERPVDGGAQPRHRADRHRIPADLPGLRRSRGLRAGHGRLRPGRRQRQHRRRQRALPPAALDHVPGLRRDGHRLLLARPLGLAAAADRAAAGDDDRRPAGAASAGRSSSCR